MMSVIIRDDKLEASQLNVFASDSLAVVILLDGRMRNSTSSQWTPVVSTWTQTEFSFI